MRILDFFGVPAKLMDLAALDASALDERQQPFAALGSVEALATGLAGSRTAMVLRGAAALYAYASDDRDASLRAITSIAGGQWAWAASGASGGVTISDRCPGFTGPMSGVQTTVPLAPADGLLIASHIPDGWAPIVSANGAPAFFCVPHHGVPAYIAASAAMTDIDEPVDRNYYDIKAHFLSAVPLVMFITAVFRQVMWRPRELGACLIIDDPLLKSRYGFCDFRWLRDRMREHQFTTSIAFIPWNWRRTAKRASEFFRAESDLFSVSIHGCDHIAGEFGTSSTDALNRRARLAQARMGRHRMRTHISHDPVMVFPQGVFSPECPGVLKRHDFVAAVNTEISPVGDGAPRTLVRDAWDVAVLRYGSFPIYTRRYERHGLENFAFDLLLGKPCFIVAHHDEFRAGATALLALIGNLRSLNCALRWRSPLEVVRRAYRTRRRGTVQVQMYGTEMLLANDGEVSQIYDVEKPEREPSSVARVVSGDSTLQRTHDAGRLRFRCELAPRAESLVKVGYTEPTNGRESRSAKYELSVAARRILSEFRDEYVQKLYAVAGAR